MSTEQDKELRLRAAAMLIVETPTDFRLTTDGFTEGDNQKAKETFDGQA